MNNTRKTVNDWFFDNVKPSLSGWEVITGDEANPEIKDSYIGLNWIRGNKRGLRSNSRMRFLQVEVFVSNQDTNRAEEACTTIEKALNLFTGTNPILAIPKMAYADVPDDPTNPAVTPLYTTIIVRSQMGLAFGETGTAPSQDSRLYILTLEVDYIPG